MSAIAGVAGVDIELITSSTSVGESGNGDAPGEAGSDCVGVASSDGDPELDCVAGAGAGADGDPDADADTDADADADTDSESVSSARESVPEGGLHAASFSCFWYFRSPENQVHWPS